MERGIQKLAKWLKDRENPLSQGYIYGTVLGTSPVIVKPDKYGFMLDEIDLVIPTRLKSHTENVKMDGIEHSIEYEGLQVNDKVVLQPSIDNQQFLIIDKVV